jgi:hypothetical protein
LLVKAKGYATYSSGFIGQDSGTVEFVLDQGVRYYGHVVQVDSGEPVSDIGVRLTTAMVSDQMDVRTDAQGAFEFPMVRPGVYDASIAGEEWVIANHPLRLDIDSDTEAESQVIEVAGGGVISGRVYIESTGRGIGSMKIHANTKEFRLKRQFEARTDSDENYRIKGLPQAVYMLFREKTEEYPSQIGREENARYITVAATLNQESTGNDFALKTGLHIIGRVVDVNDEVIDGARIHARNQSTSSRESSSTSNSNGAFRMAGLVPHIRIEILPVHHYRHRVRRGTIKNNVRIEQIPRRSPRGHFPAHAGNSQERQNARR